METKDKAVRALLMRRTRVDEQSGCWLWTGPQNMDGVSLVSMCGKQWTVSRLVVEKLLGQQVGRGECVRRACGQPSCWRPEHLTVGKRRGVARGGPRLDVKLSPGADAYFWRQYELAGMSVRTLALYHGLTEATVEASIERFVRRCIADDVKERRDYARARAAA